MKKLLLNQKLVSLLMILMLTVSLVGCGNTSKTGGASGSDEIPTVTPLPTTDEPTKTPTKTPTAGDVTVTPVPDDYKMQAVSLSASVLGEAVTGKEADDCFTDNQMRLALDLFKAMSSVSKDENLLISPLSIQLALAMTANGADSKTREEMETLLGGEISIEELNKYLYQYVNNLPSDEKYKMHIANSVWANDDDSFVVYPDFLQLNANYYAAEIYKSEFNGDTVNDINSWVSKNTDGMINKLIDTVDSSVVMYLINAIAFDAEWESEFKNVHKDDFTSISGNTHQVEMMDSKVHVYLNDGKATGFIKNYKDNSYSFAALLPNDGVDIYDYINDLDAQSLLNLLKNPEYEDVQLTMPKFTYDYELEMTSVLESLGMSTAFNPNNADFSKLGQSEFGNIYIGSVLHKTFIEVDESGTKASAVTGVIMEANSAMPDEPIYITLDRPFVYMIIDNETNLPVFMGVVTDI